MKIPRKLFPIVTLLCIYGGTAVNAQSVYEFAVTGVASNDRLNVRKGYPETDEYRTIVGSFGPRATGIQGTGLSVIAKGRRWFEVRIRGTVGWANGKYLKQTRLVYGAGDWSPLTCSGTEPFWTLNINGNRATLELLSDPDGASGKNFTLQMSKSANNQTIHGLTGTSPQGDKRITAAIKTQKWCSDGMSDYDYGLAITFWNSDGTLYSGCCQLQ